MNTNITRTMLLGPILQRESTMIILLGYSLPPRSCSIQIIESSLQDF